MCSWHQGVPKSSNHRGFASLSLEVLMNSLAKQSLRAVSCLKVSISLKHIKALNTCGLSHERGSCSAFAPCTYQSDPCTWFDSKEGASVAWVPCSTDRRHARPSLASGETKRNETCCAHQVRRRSSDASRCVLAQSMSSGVTCRWITGQMSWTSWPPSLALQIKVNKWNRTL